MTKPIMDSFPEEFNLRNPCLDSFILDAAIEIDNHIIGKDKLEYNNIFRLGKLLYGLTLDQGELTHHITVFKEPVEEYRRIKFDNQSKIEDLAKELNKICDDLESMVLLPREKQENLSKFCVNLSRRVTHYRQMYYPLRRYLIA